MWDGLSIPYPHTYLFLIVTNSIINQSINNQFKLVTILYWSNL